MRMTMLFLGLAIASAQQPLTKPQASPATTANPTTTPAPRWAGEIMQSLEGKLVPLESQRPEQVTKVKGFGLRGATSGFVFKGSSATTKVGASPAFVVKIALKSSPKSVIQLYRLEVVSGKRYLLLAKVTSMARNSGSVSGDSQVGLEFDQVSADVIGFKPGVPLAPGEYVATIDGEPLGFLFRVE